MKHLYLLRHAKASENSEGITDFERPLTIRGRQDAAGLAQRLLQVNRTPGVIISSPATRALYTARLVAEGIRYPLRNIRVDECIYEAWIEQLITVIHEIDDRYTSAMIVGHNPGLHLLSNFLGHMEKEKFPTCSLAIFSLNIQSWDEAGQNTGRLELFITPKK